MGNIVYRDIRNAGELWEVMEVMKDAWGMDDYTEAVPPHIMWAIIHNGGLLRVAEDGGHIVGFVLGFTGRDDKHGLYHYSHMVGVRRRYRGRGIAFRLKLEQREWARSRGYSLIIWTYDPHQGLNARFNFGKLGVINREFYPNYYGEMRDSINRGLPSDRFRIEWWINSPRVENRVNGRDTPPTFDEIKDHVYTPVLSRLENSIRVIERVKVSTEKDLVLVEFPGDINSLRDADLKEAIRWKIELRKVFSYYIDKGYIVVEHVPLLEEGERRNFYLLWRTGIEPLLRGEYPWR